MTLEEYLSTHGVAATLEQRPAILELLREETAFARKDQGASDSGLLCLLCVQLFAFGVVEDSLPIWSAKRANMDAGCSIEVQLLCGAGLEVTRDFLAKAATEDGAEALEWIDRCVAAGNFEGFTSAQYYEDRI